MRRRTPTSTIKHYPVLVDSAKCRAAKEDGNTDGW